MWRFAAGGMLAVSVLIGPSDLANAGGLIGDLVNAVAPGVGTTLDDINRQAKDSIPPYKAAEEGLSHAVSEANVQATAPLLQAAIARSRDDALGGGVQPIPIAIRQNLTGFISDHILNIAKYRVGGGGDLSLQINAIRYGDAAAITLDYVIVFANQNDALYNASLWAHELTHVRQYQDWGIKDFAIKYLRNSGAVEAEAYDIGTKYVAWAASGNINRANTRGASISTMQINQPVSSFGVAQNSSTCSTVVTACSVSGSAPVGTPCWCNTPYGAATGALIPSSNGPMPGGAIANVCTTSQGSCPMSVQKTVGQPCQCVGPAGSVAGVAQIRQPNNACTTPNGMCPLASPLYSGDRCYCPTGFGGVVWGQVP